MLGETGLAKVLEVSYISKSHRELLDLLLDTNDGSDLKKSSNLCKYLDNYRYQIIGQSTWKSQLEDSHYQEFSNQTQSKKRHESKSNMDMPSSLIRFIRNLHAHAAEKMHKYPNGVTEAILFPNDYGDKRQFVEYWMNKFPKLFHINAALRHHQIEWLDWSSDNIPDQLLEALNTALNFERDHGRIIQKYDYDETDNFGKCKLDILITDDETFTKNSGKVITIAESTLTVNHGYAGTLIYPVNNPRRNEFNIVFGLEKLNSTTLCFQHVILVINQYQSVDEVSRCLHQFRNFRKVTLKWSDISGSAQREIQSNGTIEIQKQEYPVNMFPLQTLSGNQLNELLQTQRLKLFKQPNQQLTYVQRWLIRKGPHEAENDVIYFIKDRRKWWRRGERSISVNSDEEFCNMKILTHQSIVFLYDVCVEQMYEKMLNLAAGRRMCILEYTSKLHKTPSGRVPRVRPIQMIPVAELFREETSNLIIISGGAGMGKTTYLKHLAVTLQIPDTVVLHISVTTVLSYFKGDVAMPVVDILKNSCGLNKFEADVIKNMNILLLLDALDEVDSELVRTAADLMRILTSYKGLRLIVSMRTHFVEEFSKVFEFSPDLVYSLDELSKLGQSGVCMSHWKRLARDDQPSELVALQLVNSYAYNLHEALTPLHCGILADIHCEDAFQTSTSSGFKPLNVMEMYEALVKKNSHRYLIERNHVNENHVENRIYSLVEDQYRCAHVYLGIQNMVHFKPEKLKGPLKHPDISLTPGQGFLDSTDPVMFTHITFADFFVDTWVFEVISRKSQIGEKYIEAFSEMFRERYITLETVRSSHVLERLLKDHKEQLYFPFTIDVFDFKRLGELCYGREQAAIYKTLVGSFKRFSPYRLLEKLRLLQQAESVVVSSFIRPYNGSGPELDRLGLVTLYTDFVIKWLGLGGRPSKFLEKCPNGFYLEIPVAVKHLNGDPEQATCFRLTYIPKDSVFARNKESDEVTHEILIGEDYDNLNISMRLLCP